MRRVLYGTAAAAVVAIMGAMPAVAGPVAVGSLYEVSSGVAQDATPGNVPAGPADVTFTAPSNPLSFNPTDSSAIYTIGDWLATGGATILTGAGHLGDTLDNTLIMMMALRWSSTGSLSSTSRARPAMR